MVLIWTIVSPKCICSHMMIVKIIWSQCFICYFHFTLWNYPRNKV